MLCGLGIQGVDVASWTAAVPGPLPQPLPLFATALLERTAIYLVTRGSTVYVGYSLHTV